MEIGLFTEYWTSLLGVVCVGVELAVVFVLSGFSQQVFPIKDLGFLLLVFSPGGGWPPSPKYSSMSGPSSFFVFRYCRPLIVIPACCNFVLSIMTVVACTSVVNNDSCGVHSRPYHS